MHYLRYKSNITCLLSCSVWAFTPTTFTACEHNSCYYAKQIRLIETLWNHISKDKIIIHCDEIFMLITPAPHYQTCIHFTHINTVGSTVFSWSWIIYRRNCCFYDRPFRYLVSYVDLGEAESLQMNAGGTDGRSNGFHQQLLQILAYKGPSLLQDLHDRI